MYVYIHTIHVFIRVLASGICGKVLKGKDAPVNLSRWFNYISSLPEMQKAAATVPAADSEKVCSFIT